MRLLVLLVISFISIESRSNNGDNESSGGQSDPPKFENTFESHESYRATVRANHEKPNLEEYKSSAVNNLETFKEAISSENVEYFESDKANDKKGNHEKLLELNNLESSEEIESPDISNGSSFVPCELGSSRVSSYIKLGTKVIGEDFNYSRDDENSSDNARTNIVLDVTHDVFETSSSGLLQGFIYKIELTQPQSLDVIDFLIESRAHTGEKVGEFFEDDQEDQRKALNLIDNLNKKNIKSSKNLNSSNIFSHNVIEDQIVNANACELNTFYHKFNESKREPKLSINWTLGNMRSGNFHIAEGAENFITFRLLYRRRSRLEIFQKSVTFNLLRECSLLVKHQINWFSSSLVPEHVKNCTFRFAAPSNQFNGLSQGLLIKILRLNVPCSSGGYLKFNGTITMCGKLEEFPESRRTLYFPSFTNASFSVNNNPKFKFIFKFVDNCYNVTFLERNGSFVIEPSDSPLKCHFKIHLPFGNRIRLKFRLNGDGETVDDSYKAIKKNVDEKFSYSDLKIDDFSSSTSDVSSSLPSGPSYCNGILIEIVNRLNEKWDQCASLSSGNSGYTLTSSDNVLLIRFTKQATSFPQSSKQHKLSLEYSVEPIETIVSQCAFGWILAGQFCLSTFNELLTWQEAENFCNTLSGHLASIQNENEQQLIDAMLLNSPYFNDKMSFWIGASDKHFEGDFRWTDGLPFSYLNWFPGWKNHQNYNKQPNDDGFSNQDCVEIRRNYNQPSSSSSFLTESFMWNDRDCFTKNSFICERSVVDQPVNNYEKDDCNQTIYLSQEKTKLILTSPGFPRSYSENMNCVTFVVAPIGFRVLIEFEEFVLEHEPQCLYDYLEIFEPTTTQIQARNVTARHFHGSLRKNKKTLKHDMNNNDISFDHSNSGSQKSTKLILQPSNVTYNVFAPAPSLNNQVPRRMCGDWSSKLKLLRYRTKGNLIGIRFSSDYSYHFSGFKARVLLERDNLELRAASECIDEHLKLFNDSCYLVVSFPEVEWVVAQKICHSMGAQLSSVSTLEEQRFIISTIKANQDYNPSTLYWLGAEYKRSGQFMEWTDGTKVTYSGWFMGEEKVSSSIADDVCLALQWKVSSSSMIPSNFFWTYQKCTYTGGYVCKKSRSDNVLIQNQTITGIEGRMTSPNYPNPYSPNLNYWTKIIVPEKFRIVVQFQKLDIEQQHECLYDYVSIQDMKFYNDFETNFNDKSVLKREDELLDYRNEDDEMLYGDERKIHLLNKRSKVESKSSSLTETSPSFQPYIRLCGLHEGDMSKFDFVSTSNEIYFNFFTDHSISGEGFSAMWRSIDISACPGQTFTSREGTLTSPNFPHFLLHNLNCTFTVQAPKGRKIWIEFNDFDIIHDAEVLLDLGEDNLLKPFTNAKNIADGVFLSRNDKVKVVLRTGSNPRGKGFKLSFRTMFQNVESRILRLTNATVGNLFHLNHPHTMPPSINFTQHLSVPLGNVFSVELHGMKFGEQTCDDGSSVEVIDKYADNNGTYWLLCRANKQGEQQKAAIFITSYLNTIHIRQRSSTNSQLGLLNATIRVQPDINYKLKLLSTSDEWVESCQPNPCNNEGKCIVAGKRQMCQCKGHFTGRFCGLNMCELDPCVFGTCELTNSSFKCICQTGYLGLTCDQRQKPCSENPCEGRGECIEKNGGYTCRCFAWFEGLKCEKRMRIPYRPLSERMLQEPFWLGLITVFVVLAVIGLVWCAKRHFPEKIEKLLQEEADRNRPAHLRHHHHISLREQLQVAGAANNSLMQSGSTQAIVTTPGTQKSIFGRLGIRKPSLLSLSSPQPPQGGSTARTFSLDDLLMPLPRLEVSI